MEKHNNGSIISCKIRNKLEMPISQLSLYNILEILGQWTLLVVILLPRGYLTMSGAIFGHHNFGKTIGI